MTCPVCDGPLDCTRHEVCDGCGAAVEPREQVTRGYCPSHEMRDCETYTTFLCGASVAFGIVGMGEAIRLRSRDCVLCAGSGSLVEVECDMCSGAGTMAAWPQYPPHDCARDGHSYGHGEFCHYCGINEDAPVPSRSTAT